MEEGAEVGSVGIDGDAGFLRGGGGARGASEGEGIAIVALGGKVGEEVFGPTPGGVKGAVEEDEGGSGALF